MPSGLETDPGTHIDLADDVFMVASNFSGDQKLKLDYLIKFSSNNGLNDMVVWRRRNGSRMLTLRWRRRLSHT